MFLSSKRAAIKQFYKLQFVDRNPIQVFYSHNYLIKDSSLYRESLKEKSIVK